MKLLARSHIAMLLTVIYTLIIMGTLAPIALQSGTIAHAVIGECVGDCAICGCSPEQSANRTCCCWKKKQATSHEHESDQGADCCKPILSCGCPCDGTNPFALFDASGFELLPYHFSEVIPASHGENLSTRHCNRLKSRHGDPPDPPPKLISA